MRFYCFKPLISIALRITYNFWHGPKDHTWSEHLSAAILPQICASQYSPACPNQTVSTYQACLHLKPFPLSCFLFMEHYIFCRNHLLSSWRGLYPPKIVWFRSPCYSFLHYTCHYPTLSTYLFFILCFLRTRTLSFFSLYLSD